MRVWINFCSRYFEDTYIYFFSLAQKFSIFSLYSNFCAQKCTNSRTLGNRITCIRISKSNEDVNRDSAIGLAIKIDKISLSLSVANKPLSFSNEKEREREKKANRSVPLFQPDRIIPVEMQMRFE